MSSLFAPSSVSKSVSSRISYLLPNLTAGHFMGLAGMGASFTALTAQPYLPEVQVTETGPSGSLSSSSYLLDDSSHISGGDTFDDALALVPGLGAGNPANGVFSLRGMTGDTMFTSLNAGSNPLVIAFENGLPLSPATIRKLPPLMWGLENAAVLRGPQPHLEGPNAMAGAIILDRSPAFSNSAFSGDLWAEAGNYHSLRGGLSASGALVADRLFFKFSTFHEESDGYTTNLNYDDEKTGAHHRDRNELQLAWLTGPSGGGRVDFSLVWDRSGGNPYPIVHSSPTRSLFDHEQILNTEEGFPSDRWASSLRANLPLTDHLRLKSVTGFQRLDAANSIDLDGSNLAPYYTNGFIDETRFTQYLGLEFDRENFHGTLGAYFENSEYDVGNVGLAAAPIPSPKPINAPFSNRAIEDVTVAALHSRMDWEFSPHWHLGVGARLNYEEREKQTYSAITPYFRSHREDEYSDTVLIPDASIAWKPDNRHAVGARVSRAYRSGGIAHSPSSATVQPFENEDGWEVEAFANSQGEFLDLSGSAFYSRLKDLQVPYLPPGGFANLDNLIANAGEATRYGIELAAKWKPVDGLTFTGALAWTYTNFDELRINGLERSGISFPNAPEWTAGIGANYQHASGVYASTLFSFADSTYSFANDPDLTALETRKLLSARLGYRWKNADIYAFANNLLDDEYALYRLQHTAFGSAVSGITGSPRTFGIGFRCHW
jgi:iron complex outermembrane receptor protein